MTDYLTFVEVLAIHHDQIERFGGSHGLRDAGALEAALFRPQSGYYSGIFAEAAALWESLSQSHPFIDSNKRTAFAAAYTFLSINGIIIDADPIKTFTFITNLHAKNNFHMSELEKWLRANAKPIKST